MNLSIDNRLDNTTLSIDKDLESFSQKLNEALDIANINVYNCYDKRHFTLENIDKIWDKPNELISKYINQTTIDNADDGKLYEVIHIKEDTVKLIEYTNNIETKNTIDISRKDLPLNIKENMFFRNVNGKYVIDTKTTESIYNELENYKNELYEEQLNYLKNVKKEGSIYKVVSGTDDCEYWYTELINLETNERFQDIEFPHDIYHQVTVDSLVKYENGKYCVLDGTSVFDLNPKQENYCEIEGKYITKKGKLNEEEYIKFLKEVNGKTKKNENFIVNFFYKAKERFENFMAKFKN